MRSVRSYPPRRVAVAGLAVLALVLLAAFNVSRLPFIGDGPTYHADFAEIGNLREGSEVRIAGIKVGAVDAIALQGAKVRVTFHVDGAAFGPQTTASIELKTLLGAEYVALHPAGSGQLPRGGTIPLSRTTAPFEIVPAVGQLTDTVSQLDTTKLATALSTLADTFRGTPSDVRSALTGLGRLSRTVASRDAGIGALLRHLRGVSGVLAGNGAQIVSIVDDSNSVLTVLDQRSRTIGQLLVATRSLATELRGVVTDNQRDITPALNSLDTVAAVLDRDRTYLARTIHNLRPFVTVFTSALGTGGFFDATIKFGSTLSVCDTREGNNALSAILDPVLSTLNQAATGRSTPCLTLAPPAGGR